MARLSLNCSCGWNFFIPGTTPGHEVTCPSCGQVVRIPGRKPGQSAPQTAGEIALEVQRRQSRVKMVIGAAIAAVIVIAAGAAFFMRGSSEPDDEGKGRDKTDRGLTRLGDSGGDKGRKKDPFAVPPGQKENDLPPAPPEPPPLYSAAQIEELRHNVFANVWLINMATVVSECLRFRNLTSEWAQVQADVSRYEEKIKHDLGEMSRVGAKVVLEPYLAHGDQIIGFAQRDFTTMKPGEAATVLNTWINAWTNGSTLEQVPIVRDGKKMTIYMEFPEATKDLLILTRHPALAVAGAPGDALLSEILAVPQSLLADVQTAFAALPPGYRALFPPADRKRFDDMMTNKRGSSDDIEWLKAHVLNEAVPSFQRDAEQIHSQVLALEPKLKENAATDAIFRKNGTKVEGQIVETTESYVKIKTRFGAASIPKDEISKIEKGKGSATEFPAQYAAAKGNLDKLVPLLAWCSDKSLRLEKEFVAYNILALDASNDKARSAAGLGRPAIVGGIIQAPPSKITIIEVPKPPTGTEPPKSPPVDKTIDIIAADVVSRSAVFADVVREMRTRTEPLTTPELPAAPEKAAKGVAVIQNPLTFDPSQLTVPSAVEVGTWWSALSADDRRQFAKYYGLWCAYSRGRK
jgi:hypothetical protein